jgi:cytochrome c peroxidase
MRLQQLALSIGLLGVTAIAVVAPQTASTVAAPAQGLTTELLDRMTQLPGGLGPLPEPPDPAENRTTRPKADLGRLLFNDKRLSRDDSISCATCHDRTKAYSDGRQRPVGIGNRLLPRHTPSLLNVAYNSSQFWDGRARTLEDQVSGPILSGNEMGMDERTLVARLRSVPEYRRRFRQVFGREPTFGALKRAIAAFERSLVTPDSPFDRYAKGDKQALTEQQKRGLILFFGKAACSECHNGPNFTDNKFHSLGLLPGEAEDTDIGRQAITGDPADRHAFKTPSLRNSTLHPPYMHDGSIPSLRDVIDFYSRGAGSGTKSELVFKLGLTPNEEADLLAFLQSLAGQPPALAGLSSE